MASKKVLLVDDVKLIIELEKAFLKGLSVDILVAKNGSEALEIALRENPDLIYLDCNMPVMDGPTCCRALKANPLTKDIPVIMVTTAGRDEDQFLCKAAGCDEFLTKPINGKVFLEKGRKCLADFDRRRRRYSYATDVEFLKNGEPRYGMTTDLSVGGVYIAVLNNGIPDDPVDLSFSLPIAGENVIVAARARVAWENKADNLVKPNFPEGVGVEFTSIDPQTVELIEKFFEEAFNKKY